MTRDFSLETGRRLRSVRLQQGLSLTAVQEKSGGRWKAVVIGSYERADRGVTVESLSELAHFYHVPIIELLPLARYLDSIDCSAATTTARC